MKRAAVVLMGAVLLSGCAPQPSAIPSSSPTSSSTPEGTPTPTSNPASAKATVAQLVIGPDGLGPLQINSPPPVTDPAVDILVFDPDHCAAVDGAEPGKWVANYEPALSADTNVPFGVYVQDGVLRTIQSYDPDIQTIEGIGIGDSAADAAAAYGAGEVLDEKGFNSIVYIVRGLHGNLLVEVLRDDAAAIADYGEQAGTVLSIRVFAPDLQIYGTANTDSSTGYCLTA